MSKTSDARNNLRDLSDDELRQGVARLRDELFRIKIAAHTNQVASTALLGQKRREISRSLTILQARGLGLEAQGSAKRQGK